MLSREADQLAEVLKFKSNEVKELISDSTLVFKLLNKPLDSTLNENEYSLLIFSGEELVYWNSNTVLPYLPLTDYQSSIQMVRLRNGYYILQKQSYSGVTAIGLIRIQEQYPVKNRYLSAGVAVGDLDFPHLLLSEDGGEPIKLGDEVLFYVDINHDASSSHWIVLVLFLLGVLMWVIVLVNFVLISSIKAWVKTGILALGLAFLRLVWIPWMFPADVSQFTLFHPNLYSSPHIAGSLGALVLNIIFGGLFLLIQVRSNSFEIKPEWAKATKWLAGTGILIFLIFCFEGVRILFQSLVMDSQISFDIGSFLILNIYSIIGVISLLLSLIIFFLLTNSLLDRLQSLPQMGRYWLIAAVFGAYFIIGIAVEGPNNIRLILPLWGIIFSAGLLRWPLDMQKVVNYTSLISWLVLFSFLSAFMLTYFGAQKEMENRLLFANKLALERDPILEYVFDDIYESMLKDPFVSSYFQDPLIPKKQLDDRLSFLYFGGYMNRYEINVHTFNRDGARIKDDSEQALHLEHYTRMAEELGEDAKQSYLKRLEDRSGRSKYLLLTQIHRENELLGSLAIELELKAYRQTNVYPELLLDSRVKFPEVFDLYSYAIYEHGKLADRSGNYPYRLKGSSESLKEEVEYFESEKHEHLVLQASPYKQVWVSRPKAELINPVSLFSYLFCLLLLCILCAWLIQLGYRFWKSNFRLAPLMQFTFRSKIHFAMLFIIVFSFVIIGAITVIYFQSQFDIYHQQRLSRKVGAVSKAMEIALKEAEAKAQDPNSVISIISEIHSIDINLYDHSGSLLSSSQPKIFDRGLISRKMDPRAMSALAEEKRISYIQTEQIGKLSYLSIYVPIMKQSRYLNLPYFAKEKNLRQDIGSFLVALINVYVLLLVGAGFLVLFISNSITQSLREIGHKLKGLTLGSKNEPIVWNTNDEIGILVSEYNKMIGELEQSAELLAKSERESAWREMAKQVAHEITNPLTPMKLSIQHLLKAQQQDAPNVKELTAQVASTLIEQIENLSVIASDFSDFAQMPKPNIEELKLNEILESAVALYKDVPDLSMLLEANDKEVMISADKSHMMSVFNNLLKNAVQAIPGEAKGIIKISLEHRDGMVQVTVEDNGVGIPEDQKNKVFVPNFTTKNSGMGLGLAITHKIIEESGGSISFVSEVNKGTRFLVELPTKSVSS